MLITQPSIHCEIQEKNSQYSLIKKLQEKALRIINFQLPGCDMNPLFKTNKILKLTDFITYKISLFVRDCLQKYTLEIFHHCFQNSRCYHNHNASAAATHLVDTPQVSTTHYQKNSMKAKSTDTWSYLQNFIDTDLSLAIDVILIVLV